jgi:glycosyltransferase involved in cell wall biosynthesis
MLMHGYNGKLISSSEDNLVACLEELISSPDIRIQLGANAHKTATFAFNLDRWKAAWSEVLDRVQNL